jgi:hypothetical protein
MRYLAHRQLHDQHHEQKNGSLGCIYKDVLFSTANTMKPTNERLAGLETAPSCSPLARRIHRTPPQQYSVAGPTAINNMTPDVQHVFGRNDKRSWDILQHEVSWRVASTQLAFGVMPWIGMI